MHACSSPGAIPRSAHHKRSGRRDALALPSVYAPLLRADETSIMNAPPTLAELGAAEVEREALVSLELIRTLVAFDTTSRDSNLALIDWVREYLARHGIDSTLTFD